MALSYSNPRLRNLYYRCPTVVKEWFVRIYSLRRRPKQFGGVFAAQLAELEQNVHSSTEEITKDQISRLKRMVIHAGTNVPYYRQLFQSIRFKPESLQTLADLRQLPVLDKETVRERYSELITTTKKGRTISTHTGGTTGKALHLTISLEAYQRHYACQWFHYRWAGIQWGDRIATLAGHPVAEPNSWKPPFWIYDGIENELLFSSQHIAPQTLPLYADALADFKPVLIRGYPSSIYLLALHLLDAGRKDIRPRAIYTSSETLLDFQRGAIEQAFGCRVYSYYSNSEVAAHILQCQEGNFHIVTEVCVVEILGPDGSPAPPGELGELVCTGLIDNVMPLIRYRIGDTGIVAAGHCSCGLNTPILSALTGRVDDVVVTPEGRHVGRLGHVFHNSLNVKEAQIVQENTNSVLVKIVPRPGYKSDDELKIVNELRLRLGSMININIELVDSIPRTSNGKFRFVISSVPIRIEQRTMSGTDHF